MKRKLVKQGSATLMVSLPIKWIKRFNLKKGDEVGIEEQENAVIIASASAVSVEAEKIQLKQKLVSLYREGFDEIEIRFKDIKIIDKIKEILNELPGFEIVQQKKDSCLIKNISGNEEIGQVMNKLSSEIIRVSEELLNNLKNKETDLTHIIYSDSGVNKQANLAMRLSRNASRLFYRAACFEEIGDIYKNLAEFITKNNVKLNDKELKTFEKLNSMLKSLKFEKLEITSDINCCFRQIYARLMQLVEYSE